MIRKTIMGAAAMFCMTAIAQTNSSVTQLTKGLSANRYEGRIGLNNVRNLPDAQLQEIGKRVSANGFPTKLKATTMLRNAKSSMVSNRRKASATSLARSVNKANYVASDTTFWESFEGPDAETQPYVPTNLNKWSTKSAVEDITTYLSAGLCPTWTEFEGDGYYVPYATDGRKMIICMYGEEVYGSDGVTPIAPAPQQDEWMVSPTINAIEATNVLSFDICYSPWNTHYFKEGEKETFDMDRIAYDVEVFITTNTRSTSYNPDDYTRVYRLSEEVDKQIAGVDMNNEAEIEQLLLMKWRHIQIPLEQYDGKNIRVAFRYSGTKGGVVMFDAIRVSDLLPVALFDRPEGSFYFGYSKDAALLSAKVALMPAYTPSEWTNYSNADVKDCVWRYSMGSTSGTSKDYDLALPGVAPGTYDWPTLQTNAGKRSDEYKGGDYSLLKAGGDGSINLGGDVGVMNFALGNYDPTKLQWTAALGKEASAFGTGGEAFWAPLSDYYYTKVNGIANVFDAPASPYVFNEVTQAFEQFLNLGGMMACTVYRAEDLGNGMLQIMDEVIAQTTTYSENPIASGGSTLTFSFPQPIVVDGPIAISIDGFDDGACLLAIPLAQALNHDGNRGYGFALLRTKNNGVTWVEIASTLSANEAAGNMQMSFCMGMNATFAYVHSTDGDVFKVADAGEAKSFNIDTYWNPNGSGSDAVDTKWNVACSEKWVKAETVVDEVAQKVSVKVTAEALPEGIEGRHATVTISALGCEEQILVLQGTDITGISDVTEGSTMPDGVYTLSGQRINSANATNGIFLVKKNGKVVKTMK